MGRQERIPPEPPRVTGSVKVGSPNIRYRTGASGGPMGRSAAPVLATRTRTMAGEDSKVDQVVQDLMEGDLTKEQRVRLLRELVRRGEDLPDDMLDSALQKLMDRLTE